MGQARRHRSVVNGIADAEHQAADQVGIDLLREHGFTAQHAPELILNALDQAVVERRGRRDLHPHPTLLLIAQIAHRLANGPQKAAAAVRGDHFEEAQEDRSDPARQDPLDKRHLLVVGDHA